MLKKRPAPARHCRRVGPDAVGGPQLRSKACGARCAQRDGPRAACGRKGWRRGRHGLLLLLPPLPLLLRGIRGAPRRDRGLEAVGARAARVAAKEVPVARGDERPDAIEYRRNRLGGCQAFGARACIGECARCRLGIGRCSRSISNGGRCATRAENVRPDASQGLPPLAPPPLALPPPPLAPPPACAPRVVAFTSNVFSWNSHSR